MTNDQFNDLCGVLEKGFSLISSQLTLSLEDIENEIKSLKERLGEGIDTYEQN